MNIYHYRKDSPLRRCIALMKKSSTPMTVDGLMAACGFSRTACYNALRAGVSEGYVREVEMAVEKRDIGHPPVHYEVTKKRMPAPIPRSPKTEAARAQVARMRAELEASKNSGSTLFRHWQDAALFGDAPAISASVKGRVHRQSMEVGEDELVAA